jgi:hypothetical protein
MPGFTPTRRRIRFSGIVSRRADSVAVGPVGGVVGWEMFRLRLGGDSVRFDEDRDRVILVVVVVLFVIAFLRLGLDLVLGGGMSIVDIFGSSLVVSVRRFDIPVLCGPVASCVVLIPCRYCCNLPLKLVILLTGTSSSLGSNSVWVGGGILLSCTG